MNQTALVRESLDAMPLEKTPWPISSRMPIDQDFIDCVADVRSVFGEGVRISYLTLCQIPGFQLGATAEERDRQAAELARKKAEWTSA